MLLTHLLDVCKCTLALILVIWMIAGYTYIANKRRGADDPKKQDYDPLVILIAPFTAPFLLGLAILFYILRAVLFAAFIVVFTVLLIAIRKPFIFKLWDRFATWIGDPLLKANTVLIRAALRPWNPNPQPPY